LGLKTWNMRYDIDNPAACELCALPLRSSRFTDIHAGVKRRFCCAGCQMVYAMLMEAADAPDPARFKETELYRRCVAAGVVPASLSDLESMDRPAGGAGDQYRREPVGERAMPLEYRVEGMWCPACAWVIGAALERLDGLRWVRCDFSTDRLRCRFDPVRTTPEQIGRAVRRLGYRTAAVDSAGGGRTQRRDFVRLAVSAVLSANIMMLSWALYSGFFTTLNAEGVRYISWPILAMATVVLVYGGGPMARKAWSGLRHGAPGMEVLIVLGAGSAYLYSLFNWWSGSIHLYFDTAAMLVTLLLLGKLLEALAKNRVRRDMEGFLSLQPTKVRLCSDACPTGRYVAVGQLAEGDDFRVVSDEVVPADGRVRTGRGLLDASAITGEPRPVAVEASDAVTSGSRVREGDLIVRAARVGRNALLGQMIDVVHEALSRKTPLESRTDRMLTLFVPIIAGLAAATATLGVLWGLSADEALVRGVTVLVIACPCALGIAIPLARVAGMAGAGRRGILVRNFKAFEQATRIDCVVLDKTGTVTRGRWSVERVDGLSGHTREEAIGLAMALEKDVDHTIARALHAFGCQQGIRPARLHDVRVHADGISGRHNGRTVRIGSRAFAAGDGADQPPAAQNPGSPEAAALSEVVLSVDREVWAVFHFGDRLRDDIPVSIKRLKARGLDLHLVSGDAESTTRAVAAVIGIDRAAGRLSPRDKADYVHRLQAQGRHVAMVGDGVNDAPALARSALAVALHTGSPLAQHAADVTLMRGDPSQLLDFLDWAPLVDRKVTQNLWWAMVYNTIAIPVAMAGVLNPLVAVAAMLFSSLSVIGNTLLLVRHPVR
jgi:heavy metal translocating P-type ATPase